jgi:hypothetical protein
MCAMTDMTPDFRISASRKLRMSISGRLGVNDT